MKMNIEAFFTVSYGLYIISSYNDDMLNGQIVNTLFQVTAEPPRFAVCINNENLTKEYIEKSKVFSVSVLSRDASMPFIGKFGFKSGKNIDKFSDTEYKIGITKSPIVLENCISYFECKLVDKMEVDTHVLFIGEVIDAQIIKEGDILTYSDYREIKKGRSPKNAPTYIKVNNTNKKEEDKMKRYVCNVCGYVYDPAKGDPDSGIKPGTSFEDLPDDWVCPECGVGKDQFKVEG